MKNESKERRYIDAFTNSFDAVADTYTKVSEQLPFEYLELIQNTFNLTKEDRVIDLGCGAGLLTYELMKISEHVEGLDASAQMIRNAKNLDSACKISWICKPVEEFEFENDAYSLIISYESFHLFTEQQLLLKRCYNGLKKHGAVSIAWCEFHWEEILKPHIIDAFEKIGIRWDEWGYQACPNFTKLLLNSGLGFSEVQTKHVAVPTRSNIQSVAKYLTCINKALILDDSRRNELNQLLMQKFITVAPSYELLGNSIYYISYVSKLT
jgi:ubiquinone/menaquinone biosynthesis C-methylase UbiE